MAAARSSSPQVPSNSADEAIHLESIDGGAKATGSVDGDDMQPEMTLPDAQSPSRASLAGASATSLPTSSSSATANGSAQEERARPLPPVDRGRQAWTFMAAAFALEMLVFGMGNASGTFQDYHTSSPMSPLYGKSSTISAAASTLITAGQYFAPFLFSGYLNAFPHQVSRFTSTTLSISVIALIIASVRPSPAVIVLLQGLVSGTAAGAFYTPAMLWLPQWFDKRRGLATGILFLGTGVGGIIWPFIISSLLESVGFAWTLRVLALMQGTLGTAIIFSLRPRIMPQRSHTWSSRRSIMRAILPPHDKMVHSPLGIANCLLQFFHSAAFWSIRVYLSPYATSLGFSRTISTALLSEFNAATSFSYLITGRLCDVVPYATLSAILGAMGSLVLAIGLGLSQTLPSIFIFAMLYGLVNGGFSCFMTPAAREMATLGQTGSSNIFVELMFLRGIGGIVGPLVSSALYTGTSQGEKPAPAPWSDSAVYGSHGIGAVVIFTTVCMVLVSVAATSTIPVRIKWQARAASRD